MQPFPQPITDVNVFPYTTAPIELVPVIKGASGTTSVGTLMTSVFYNMDLHGGDHTGDLKKGGAYFAEATGADGKRFRTHWMHCTDAGDAPTFGLTTNLHKDAVSAPAMPVSDGLYIFIEGLSDFSTLINFKPPAIGSAEVPLGDKGWLIGTRVGTPHVNGFMIENPKLPNFWPVGHRDISISATVDKSGQAISYNNLTLVSVTESEAVFLQQFP